MQVETRNRAGIDITALSDVSVVLLLSQSQFLLVYSECEEAVNSDASRDANFPLISLPMPTFHNYTSQLSFLTLG